MLNGRAKCLAAHHRAGETSTGSQAEVIAVSTVTCPAMQQSRRPGADITGWPLDGFDGGGARRAAVAAGGWDAAPEKGHSGRAAG